MEWLQLQQTPEQELAIEVEARSLTPREASLYRTCRMYQQLLSQAVGEVMRLELLLEEQRVPESQPPARPA
jgi:hypothetical protein